jgi:hypothetical protein
VVAKLGGGVIHLRSQLLVLVGARARVLHEREFTFSR